MKILLIDVDSKIPNLALMKISAFYKKKGHNVDLKKLNISYYKKTKNSILINGGGYYKVYASIIFKCNKNAINIFNCDNYEIGGSGYSLNKILPDEIEIEEEDYTLYPDNDISYGFITRGCIRNCYFCIVPKKEGLIKEYRTWQSIIKHKKVKFLDNNFLAYHKHKQILKELIENKIKFQFNQGLDMRLIDDENAELLSESNYQGEITFSFDDLKDKELIEKKLSIINKYIMKDWKFKFFLYTHPNMEIKQNLMERINWCKQNKVLPYLMRDESCFNSINKEVYTDLAAWCNQPALFKKMKFEQFLKKRHTSKERIKKSLMKVNEAECTI